MKRLAAFLVLAAMFSAEGQEKAAPLPPPGRNIPDMPPLAPAVITSGGQRLLLGETEVEVRYDGKKLTCSRPGWWVINYPLNRIRGLDGETEGKTADEISRTIFGKPAAEVRNWYIRTAGPSGPEPPPPTGPAPIDLSPNPTLIVNNGHPRADDGGPGTPDAPLKTISAAISRAEAGSIIHVHAGVYREAVKIEKSGAAARPIRLEGVRGADGAMPAITGNHTFPPGAWKPVEGLPGVYRADLFTKLLGTMSVGGRTLIERSLPSELKEGEYCLNRASREFLNLRLDGAAKPREGETQFGKTWRLLRADAEGFLDLGAAYGPESANAVFRTSTHVWVEPKKKKDIEWHPDFPEPITGRLLVGGEFRAARMCGAGLNAQVNKYRVWVNGTRLPSVIYSTERDFQLDLPHPYRNYGFADSWDNFTLREGWNHLVFEFDTTTRPDKVRFKFGVPKGVEGVVASAGEPPDRAKPTTAGPQPHVSEYLVLGPFPAEKDLGVYVRLPGNADPNDHPLDLSARSNEIVLVKGDFVEVMGFELRHGAQFQQRALVLLNGEGLVLEGCLVRDSEVGGISFRCHKDQTAAPIIIRNNWIVNPGNVGISGSGTSDKLTAENQDGPAPGRSRVFIEHNTMVNNNWAGHPSFWESGGMKLFHLTGCVIRYNTVIGGSGPGIWLDWSHYANRIEGNFFRNAWALCVGIEASPGPNLIANNLSVNLRPGPVWFREAILSWSSARNWAVNNTIDGRWNPLPAWQKLVGADGLYLGEGRANRGTRWCPLKDRRQAYLNNIVVGCRSAVRARAEDLVEGNYTDKGKGATPLDQPPGFSDPDREDYRLRPDSPLIKLGVENEYTKLVRHDFYGLLRFPDDGRTVGALRAEPPIKDGATLVEVEHRDGSMQRLHQ